MSHAKRTSARARQRAKWGGGPFAALPRDFAQSKVVESLSPHASKLLLYLLSLYTGFNNGDFSITWTDCCRRPKIDHFLGVMPTEN